MAGKHKSDESALLILEFFDQRFHYIEMIFNVHADPEEDPKSSKLAQVQHDTEANLTESHKESKTWDIKYVKTSELT